jgi:hypothetical protein
MTTLRKTILQATAPLEFRLNVDNAAARICDRMLRMYFEQQIVRNNRYRPHSCMIGVAITTGEFRDVERIFYETLDTFQADPDLEIIEISDSDNDDNNNDNDDDNNDNNCDNNNSHDATQFENREDGRRSNNGDDSYSSDDQDNRNKEGKVHEHCDPTQHSSRCSDEDDNLPGSYHSYNNDERGGQDRENKGKTRKRKTEDDWLSTCMENWIPYERTSDEPLDDEINQVEKSIINSPPISPDSYESPVPTTKTHMTNEERQMKRKKPRKLNHHLYDSPFSNPFQTDEGKIEFGSGNTSFESTNSEGFVHGVGRDASFSATSNTKREKKEKYHTNGQRVLGVYPTHSTSPKTSVDHFAIRTKIEENEEESIGNWSDSRSSTSCPEPDTRCRTPTFSEEERKSSAESQLSYQDNPCNDICNTNENDRSGCDIFRDAKVFKSILTAGVEYYFSMIDTRTEDLENFEKMQVQLHRNCKSETVNSNGTVLD